MALTWSPNFVTQVAFSIAFTKVKYTKAYYYFTTNTIYLPFTLLKYTTKVLLKYTSSVLKYTTSILKYCKLSNGRELVIIS